jgi:hypothetical protein
MQEPGIKQKNDIRLNRGKSSAAITIFEEKEMQIEEMIINVNDIVNAVVADLKTRFNVEVGNTPIKETNYRQGKTIELPVEKNYGIFAMIINNATVSLRCETVENGQIWVNTSLNYTHPAGGANGTEIITYWIRDGKIEDSRAQGE